MHGIALCKKQESKKSQKHDSSYIQNLLITNNDENYEGFPVLNTWMRGFISEKRSLNIDQASKTAGTKKFEEDQNAAC